MFSKVQLKAIRGQRGKPGFQNKVKNQRSKRETGASKQFMGHWHSGMGHYQWLNLTVQE